MAEAMAEMMPDGHGKNKVAIRRSTLLTVHFN
jgi:hypothetical protein